jgi:hypothetical protein
VQELEDLRRRPVQVLEEEHRPPARGIGCHCFAEKGEEKVRVEIAPRLVLLVRTLEHRDQSRLHLGADRDPGDAREQVAQARLPRIALNGGDDVYPRELTQHMDEELPDAIEGSQVDDTRGGLAVPQPAPDLLGYHALANPRPAVEHGNPRAGGKRECQVACQRFPRRSDELERLARSVVGVGRGLEFDPAGGDLIRGAPAELDRRMDWLCRGAAAVGAPDRTVRYLDRPQFPIHSLLRLARKVVEECGRIVFSKSLPLPDDPPG